jgi:hypothetical protein
MLMSIGILKGAGRVAVGEGDMVSVPALRVTMGDRVIVVALGELDAVAVTLMVRVGVEAPDEERLTRDEPDSLAELDADRDALGLTDPVLVEKRTPVADMLVVRSVVRVIVGYGVSEVERREVTEVVAEADAAVDRDARVDRVGDRDARLDAVDVGVVLMEADATAL